MHYLSLGKLFLIGDFNMVKSQCDTLDLEGPSGKDDALDNFGGRGNIEELNQVFWD